MMALTPSRPGAWQLAAAAAFTLVVVLAVYHATMLRGFDFGDTAAFQDTGGEREITPRQAYPLYYAVGDVVVKAVGGDPAAGMNLASVLCGALACGLITWLAARLSGSLVGGLFAGLLFASSYTFWSQAVIAEVYTLHVMMLTASLLALAWWGRAPESLARLAVFFGVYALGFGNHLMMILLAPAATLFIALRIPGGLRGLLAPRVVLLALAFAALGSLQYLWNLSYLYALPMPPASISEALRTCWFDVTKGDWRATMVVGIDRSAYRLRIGMYWFDLRQQFGTAPVVLAALGLCWTTWRNWREAVLLLAGYIVAAAFAYTYNVGDAHVFFLPSHLFVALAAGTGVAAIVALVRRLPPAFAPVGAAMVAVLALAYAAFRFYDTWPAVDRSSDRRPIEVIERLTADFPSGDTVLIADLNWQIQNGLDYYTHHLRREIIQVRGGDRILTLPWLIHDNLAAGRDVVVLPETRRLLRTAYGHALDIAPDDRIPTPGLDAQVRRLPPGTPYVLALLQPYDDVPFDADEWTRTVFALTGGTATVGTGGVYTIMVGLAGGRPSLVHAEARPYRLQTAIGALALDIRMESWLPADTIRRAGFGHVIAGRTHALTLERGVSVVAFGPDGRPRLCAYASGLLAPMPRYRLRPAPGA